MATHTKLTYEDYLQIPNDGLKHEILDGEHFVNAAPNVPHQWLIGRIYRDLWRLLDSRSAGDAYVSPVDVELTPHDIVQPDVLAVRRERLHIVKVSRVHGPPDLVVEVLSPSSARHDRERKRARYEVAGVAQYWIVDPETKTVEDWRLIAEKLVHHSTSAQTVSVSWLEGPAKSAPDNAEHTLEHSLDVSGIWWPRGPNGEVLD